MKKTAVSIGLACLMGLMPLGAHACGDHAVATASSGVRCGLLTCAKNEFCKVEHPAAVDPQNPAPRQSCQPLADSAWVAEACRMGSAVCHGNAESGMTVEVHYP